MDETPAPTASESSSRPALRSALGLFAVPLLVVLACVGVFVGFGWIAYDRDTTGDYVDDLRSGRRPRRAQAAYELSKILVADPKALDSEPGLKQEVMRLFEKTEEEEIRGYLALVLGYTGDAEVVPTLVRAFDSADSQTRIYILWALGSIGDASAAPTLNRALTDGDAGIRKTAAFAAGQVADPSAVPGLERLLADPVADVRWNAALALARFGSSEALPVLEQMLDRQVTGSTPGITSEQQQEVMVGAVAALAAVRGRAARPALEALAADDPSLKVRQAAMEALEKIDQLPQGATSERESNGA